MINFEEFKKIKLKIATILKAEKIEESENLIKLELDLGEEKRQILAGIQKYYDAEKLVGRQIVVVTNLEPRKMMGMESNGMLLAVNVDGKPVLLQPEDEVPAGSDIT